MSGAETTIMEAVATVADAEFTSEGFVTEFDALGRSAGMEIDSGARMAVSMDPNFPTMERPAHVLELDVPVLLQLYLAYEAEPDETIVVDPRVIADYGARLRNAFMDSSSGNSAEMWYLRLTQIMYPRDPTGNASRLEARIMGKAQNEAGTPT